MPFQLSDIKNRASASVVAILMKGQGDGSSTVEEPTVIRVGRSGSNLGYADRVGGNLYEPHNNSADVGPLRMTYADDDALNYVDGTGNAQGIVVLGVVGRGEAPEAALARLSPEAPDVRELWSSHCERQMRQATGAVQSLDDHAAQGFGMGGSIRQG